MRGDMMTIDDFREYCGYESCSNDNTADAAKKFGDVSYDTKISWVFSMDCTHLLPCGKCDLSNEDCPENTRRTTHPVYPYVPWKPYPPPYNPPYRNPWAEPYITWQDNNTGTPLPPPPYTISFSLGGP